MAEKTIQDLLALPKVIPRCVVEIDSFDEPQELQDNVDDYVITPTVASELEDLVERIIYSVKRNEPGEGHYVHGAFGSGKSHFMGILGLILSNHSAIWNKDHEVIREIHSNHHDWLAENPILIAPIYMLGKKIPFQFALYESANAALRDLDKPECDFSQAEKVIKRLENEVERYGDIVWEQFKDATGFSQERFETMAAGPQEDQDAIAMAILQYKSDLTDVDRQLLYPESISKGVEILTTHTEGLGYKAVVYLVDELILYLTGKPGREWLDEFGDLVAAVDNRRTNQIIPLWLVVARQKDIPDITPSPDSQVSEREINEEMEHHQDRFPKTTRLPDRELVPIVEERILRRKDENADEEIRKVVRETLAALTHDVRETLVQDLAIEDFQRLYPFHPALIRTLIDVTSRLSRERTAIRLLYELLIERHPKLELGKLVPYSSLFDTIFQPEGITGSRQHPELDAVWDTFYKRLFPMIGELCAEEFEQGVAEESGSQYQLMQAAVKTVLLAQLTMSLRDQITVDRILHLNYTDLKGRTDFGSQNRIHDVLNQLANRTELINFQSNPQTPAKAIVSITVSAGPQLSDALKRVSWNSKIRYDAFAQLLRPMLGNRSIKGGELQDYSITWRGVERGGRVVFKNVRELQPAEMDVPESKKKEFTLFIDNPWDEEKGMGIGDDRAAIERGRQSRGEIPVGFWLPKMLDEAELEDLDEYAKLLSLEEQLDFYLGQDFSKTARQEIASRLPGYKQTKERNLKNRVTEIYLQGEIYFLDPAISPGMVGDNLSDGLDRVAAEVFQRLHPHHPRFERKITQQALRRFLNEILVNAEQTGETVEKTIDREDLAKTIGEPLELVEIGTSKIGIRPQSRYLLRLNEIASGTKVEADDVREKLKQAFGFTDDVVDLFLLYLIKGKGYRVHKGERSVDSETIDFGRLDGVTLERGQQIEIHQWTEVKKQIADTWGSRIDPPELTLASQDELWREAGRLSREAKPLIDRIEKHLALLIDIAGGERQASLRYQSVQSALDLNALPLDESKDSFDGLKEILEWAPMFEGVLRSDAKEVIRMRSSLDQALGKLEVGTARRILSIAKNGDQDAERLREKLLAFLSEVQRNADLVSHGSDWSKNANTLIDNRLAQAESGGEEREEEVKIEVDLDIREASLIVRGKKREVSEMAKNALRRFFITQAEKDIKGEIDVEIQVSGSKK